MKSYILINLIILMVGVFYLTTIKEGHNWSGDFSMYIHHAKNIAEGIDYKCTGYIYNPFHPSLGPKTYPPIFPLLLSPIYKWLGLNVTAMKIEIILIFLASLFILFLTFRGELPFQYVVTMIVIIGFSPYFWHFRDNILSDIPFLFFVYLSLFSIRYAYHSDKSQRFQLLCSILVGLLIYFSYGTRSLGLVLIPSLLIYDLIRSKKPTQFAIIVTLLSVIFVVLQTIFFHSDRSYFDQLVINPKVIYYNLFSYTGELSILWDNGYSHSLQRLLFMVVCGLAIIGYIARIKDRITILEIFLPLYVVSVVTWPAYQGARFFIPVMPLYIFYAFVGLKRIDFFQRKRIERFLFITLIAAIFVSYASKYTKVDYGQLREGISKKETIDLFDYIKENTDKEDVFIFQKPRVLSLFTGRSTSVYHQPQDDKDLWDYFQEIDAAYLIVGPQVLRPDFLRHFVEKYEDNFQEMYSNSDFKVYRIKDNLHPNG